MPIKAETRLQKDKNENAFKNSNSPFIFRDDTNK